MSGASRVAGGLADLTVMSCLRDRDRAPEIATVRDDQLMYYLLFYDVVDDYLERRTALRAEHLALAEAARERGDLVLAGALDEPADGAVLVFDVR